MLYFDCRSQLSKSICFYEHEFALLNPSCHTLCNERKIPCQIFWDRFALTFLLVFL